MQGTEIPKTVTSPTAGQAWSLVTSVARHSPIETPRNLPRASGWQASACLGDQKSEGTEQSHLMRQPQAA